ncbi:MAG: RNA polymerase sigma factor [Myxococcales bacterium]|nr:RNA polymerase sigma factor [Myxococcales bacterium]
MGAFAAHEVARLFRLHGPQVYRRALRLLGNPTDAEEALQDVFLKILDRVDDFDDQGKTLNWLYRITTNHCLNVIRGRKRRLALSEAFRVAPQRADHAVAVDQSVLRELLGRADPREAEAAVYVHLDGMSYSEAAPLLGVSKRTVGNLIARFDAWAAVALGGTS